MTDTEKNIRIRVGGLVIKENKILLIAHKKDGEIYWLVPGGGVDFGESLSSALIREYKEELNLNVNPEQPILICDSLHPKNKRHILNIVFQCSSFDGELKLASEERLFDYNFFTANQLKDLIIYPPINNELISIINKEKTNLYLGKMWK